MRLKALNGWRGADLIRRALSKKKESKSACWPTFNGLAGVIFLKLLIPLPDSGFSVKSALAHYWQCGGCWGCSIIVFAPTSCTIVLLHIFGRARAFRWHAC